MLKQKGQGLVEFALILIPLLMLILGIIEAARIFHAYLAVQHSAREAARYAVTGRPFDEFDPTDGPFLADDPTRTAAIKGVAVDQALGLTVDYWGLTPADYGDHLEKPGFFGVEIHGFDSYDEPEKLDDPGQPGLPVRVRVVYNLVILDPLYRAIIPHVRLVGHAEMVNEGIQVGHGGQPPPTFGPTPTLPEPPTPLPTDIPEPTATPEGAYIALSEYEVPAGQDIDIYLIQHNASTSYELFWIPYAGLESQIGTVTTGGDGTYTYSPYTVPLDSDSGTYTVQSRLPDGTVIASVTLHVEGPTPTPTDTSTPTQTATPTETSTPTATPTGAYIALGQYYAIPGEQITIQLIQHDPNTTYDVYWITPTSSETLVGTPTTNSSGSAVLFYTVPADSVAGTYTVESRELDGTFVANVNLDVLTITPTPTVYSPPDLVITDIALGSSTAVPGTPVTVTVQIRNDGAATTDLFDIDLYVDPEYEPIPGRPGLRKQWQSGLGAGATATLVFDITFYGSETVHQVWGQVDTTNYVEEMDENNNIYGPVNMAVAPTVVCYLEEDDMEPSPTSGWAAHCDYEDGGCTTTFAPGEYGSGYYGSASHSWGIGETGHHLRSWLDSPTINIASDASDPQLVFWHRMRSEADWDGGYLRYSIDGGSWTTVENAMIVSGGYNSQVHNQWHIRSAWAGDVGPRQVVVNVPAGAIGHSIRFRWQWECDWSAVVSDPNGWWIDDVSLCMQTNPAEPPDQPKPPGLAECAQVVLNGDFEGELVGSDPIHWGGPFPDDIQRRSPSCPVSSGGTWSVRFNANTVLWPFRPYLYQDLTMPDFLTADSTATLRLNKKVCEPGNCPNSPGTGDPLYVVLQTTGGVTLTQDITVATGAESGDECPSWSDDLFDPSTRLGGFEPGDYAGSDMRLYFYAPNDGTANAWFFIDNVELDVCSSQPVPTPDPSSDLVTVGGLAQVLLGGVPRNLPGIDVYAYTADGELFTTYTIQNSTYGFYWILPPNETIYIYAEVYIGSYRYWAQTQVPPMNPGEERHDVDLLLLQG